MSKKLNGPESAAALHFYIRGRRNPRLMSKQLKQFGHFIMTSKSIEEIQSIFLSDIALYSSRGERYIAKTGSKGLNYAKDYGEDDSPNRDDYPSERQLKSMSQTIPLKAQEILAVAEALLDGDKRMNLLRGFTKPAQFHLFMWNYNWDNGLEAVQLISKSRHCDKGTALICAWRSESVQSAFEAKKEKRKCSPIEKLVLDIHDLYCKNFYSEQIQFDPKKDGNVNRVRDCSVKTFPAIDPSFVAPSPGKKYKWPILAG